MASSDGSDPGNARKRRIELETVNVDELAELQAISENKVVVALREGNVGGIEGIGELNVEAMVGPEVGAGESRDDSDDLKKSRSVVAGDAGVGIHGLK